MKTNIQKRFKVILNSYNESLKPRSGKVECIIAVRRIGGYCLKDAKYITENLPQLILNNITKEEAERAVDVFAVCGAKAEMIEMEDKDLDNSCEV